MDIVSVLTDSADPKQYLKKMRARDPEFSSKWCTICTSVEMTGLDGKRRKIQAATTTGILRLVQSIPSPKAEPFKIWLAQVGSERLDKIADPEKSFDRGIETYRSLLLKNFVCLRLIKNLTFYFLCAILKQISSEAYYDSAYKIFRENITFYRPTPY